MLWQDRNRTFYIGKAKIGILVFVKIALSPYIYIHLLGELS